jgi:hypothetical protein
MQKRLSFFIIIFLTCFSLTNIGNSMIEPDLLERTVKNEGYKAGVKASCLKNVPAFQAVLMHEGMIEAERYYSKNPYDHPNYKPRTGFPKGMSGHITNEKQMTELKTNWSIEFYSHMQAIPEDTNEKNTIKMKHKYKKTAFTVSEELLKADIITPDQAKELTAMLKVYFKEILK